MPELTRTRPETCLSDRALDMMIGGELASELRAAAEQHLPGCSACTARYREIEAGRAAFPLEAPAFAALAGAVQPARARRKWWAFGGGFATMAAAAAALILFFRAAPDGDAIRSKGAAEKIGFFVQHRGSVRAGGPGEIVRPGDRLQIVYTAREPRYLAIFTRDAKGAATVAFPREAVGARIEAGTETALPYSFELDGATGVETLHALFCDRPLPLEPLRRDLQQHGDRTVWPGGCRADRVAYDKRP